jgi:phosphotransferase system HPr (HPr) family protein
MPDFIRLRVKITNGLGLHLRPAGRLVRLAQQFRSEVRVSCDGRAANGKSILDLMMLGAECGARLEVEISGPDAEEATAELCALIQDGFHEDEGGRDECCAARLA